MTSIRKIQVDDKGGDGTAVFAEWWKWDHIDNTPQEDDFLIIRTTGGRPVYVKMRDARELASWLLEHATDPDPAPLPQPDPPYAKPPKVRDTDGEIWTRGENGLYSYGEAPADTELKDIP